MSEFKERLTSIEALEKGRETRKLKQKQEENSIFCHVTQKTKEK